MLTGRCEQMRKYDRVIYLLDDTDANRRLVGRYIDVYEYPDGRIEVRADGVALPCTPYDRLSEIDQGAVVDHNGNYEARCRLIQEGIGIGVIPEPNASPYLSLYNLKAIKLLDEWAERQLYVCISNDRDLSDYPETRRFLDCLLAKSD